MSGGRYLDEVYFIRNDTRKIIESEWLKNNELYAHKIRFLYHALFMQYQIFSDVRFSRCQNKPNE